MATHSIVAEIYNLVQCCDLMARQTIIATPRAMLLKHSLHLSIKEVYTHNRLMLQWQPPFGKDRYMTSPFFRKNTDWVSGWLLD